MPRREESLWKDPLGPGLTGAVLLSDHIHFLADEIGLIEPFSEAFLRPAAYDLRVGGSYYEDDKRKDLADEPIEIAPNGLVYIKTKEKFNIPYYLVARYSLRVHHVYRGLLIDNGLHIDPGYCGHIWVPLHNFSMQPRILRQDDAFISVEFNRTTALPPDVLTISAQEDLVSRGIHGHLRGAHDRPIKIFYKNLDRYERRHEDFSPRLFWDQFPGEKHQSAMRGTDQRIEDLRNDVEGHVGRLRNIGWLTLVGLTVALLSILLPILYAEYGKSREAAAQLAAEVGVLRERLQEQQNRIDSIVAVQPAALQGQTATPPPQNAP